MSSDISEDDRELIDNVDFLKTVEEGGNNQN